MKNTLVTLSEVVRPNWLENDEFTTDVKTLDLSNKRNLAKAT